MSSDMLIDDGGDDIDNNQFEKLADMIDAQNDDDLDEVESKMIKKFKSLGKQVSNLRSKIKSNDKDIYKNVKTHTNNTKSLALLNKSAG